MPRTTAKPRGGDDFARRVAATKTAAADAGLNAILGAAIVATKSPRVRAWLEKLKDGDGKDGHEK